MGPRMKPLGPRPVSRKTPGGAPGSGPMMGRSSGEKGMTPPIALHSGGPAAARNDLTGVRCAHCRACLARRAAGVLRPGSHRRVHTPVAAKQEAPVRSLLAIQVPSGGAGPKQNPAPPPDSEAPFSRA